MVGPDWTRNAAESGREDVEMDANKAVDVIVTALERLQTMEAAVRAAREIIQCHETGYVTQEDIPCEIAAEIHSTRLDRFNAAVRLLEGDESDG